VIDDGREEICLGEELRAQITTRTDLGDRLAVDSDRDSSVVLDLRQDLGCVIAQIAGGHGGHVWESVAQLPHYR
jgi:hypothetical protein